MPEHQAPGVIDDHGRRDAGDAVILEDGPRFVIEDDVPDVVLVEEVAGCPRSLPAVNRGDRHGPVSEALCQLDQVRQLRTAGSSPVRPEAEE